MKLRNLFFASVAVAGLFTACSNETDEMKFDGNGNNEGIAYAAFAIQMPASTATRADVTEDGLPSENEVTEVTLLFFDDAMPHSLKDIKTLAAGAFTKNGNIWTCNEAFTVTGGKRLIYAFVNAQAAIKSLAVNDGGVAYNKIMSVGSENAASMSQDSRFTMSNAEEVQAKELKYTSPQAALAAPLAIKVERTVAKVQYTGETFEFPVTAPGNVNVKVGDVTLTEMQLINTNDKYYYLRRVSANDDGTSFTIGGVELASTYVVDPNFTNAQPVQGDNFGRTGYTSISKDKTYYCLENTMSKAAQYQGVTTGAMFKTRVVLEGQTNAMTFYRFNGAIYTDVEEVKEAAGIVSDVASWTATEWSNVNVDFYKDGVCYYPYMIKHIDNNNPSEMGIMEFGVVRNNVYKLKVTGISNIGQPTDEIDPENPDETVASYIAVNLEVKRWTVRSNENIIL